MTYICKHCSVEFQSGGRLAFHLMAIHDMKPDDAVVEAMHQIRLTPPPSRCFYPASQVYALLDYCSRRAESNREHGQPANQFEEVLLKARELGLTKEGT